MIMRRQKNLQRAASVTLSALLLAGAAASPALAANVSARHDLTAALTLANDNLYRPSSIGGTYLGVNDDGLYEFEVTIPADFQSQPTPLEPDHYYLQHEISNPEVLGSRAQYYYGIRPGKSDITYSVSETHGGTYVPKAIVHVTVASTNDYLALTGLDHIHKWYYNYDTNDSTCTRESVSSRRCTICDQTEIIQRKEKTDHQYISYVSTQPTAYAEGVRIYRCKVCGDTYTESIPKLSGDSSSTTTPSTPSQKPGSGTAGNNGTAAEGISGTAGFRDVPANAYYKDAVAWAVGKNITGGTSDNMFSPNTACSRAQIVTFLWRAAGCPAPKSQNNPFQDVKDGTYYYNAVLWAVEQGITGGVAADAFAPEATVTRAQAVTFLYRFAGSPAQSGSGAFSDVAGSAYYAGAVAWANGSGITGGTGNGRFSPNAPCTRGQIVTFLYRSSK